MTQDLFSSAGLNESLHYGTYAMTGRKYSQFIYVNKMFIRDSLAYNSSDIL